MTDAEMVKVKRIAFNMVVIGWVGGLMTAALVWLLRGLFL